MLPPNARYFAAGALFFFDATMRSFFLRRAVRFLTLSLPWLLPITPHSRLPQAYSQALLRRESEATTTPPPAGLMSVGVAIHDFSNFAASAFSAPLHARSNQSRGLSHAGECPQPLWTR